jgi:4-hydroxybenzoate polyprenyltransferase
MRFFRAVNLPTVPGDVFVGAALAQAVTHCELSPAVIAAACIGSVLLYMFGLADNDIVGAATDRDRPIPQGLISLRAARIARALCILGAIGLGVAARLPQPWWPAACALAVAIVIYNRTKWPLIMGLCRGFNLLCGFAAAYPALPPNRKGAIVATAVWTLYIFGVTKYSEGEELDPARKRRVGKLIGALVWLQLAVALVPAMIFHDFSFAIVQLAMIALLFLFKRLMPKVSAS